MLQDGPLRLWLGRGHTLQKNGGAPLLQFCASPEVHGTLYTTYYCLHFHILPLRLGAPARWDLDLLFYMGKAGQGGLSQGPGLWTPPEVLLWGLGRELGSYSPGIVVDEDGFVYLPDFLVLELNKAIELCW